MGDLLIITPTRSRPDSARRLAEACDRTCTADTDLIFAIDDDDHSYDDADLGRALVTTGPRRTCGEWTNLIAAEYGPRYRAVASLGDDHVPRTSGWDWALLAAISRMGGTGIAYGDDGLQHENLPTAPVITTDITAALGWMFLPGLIHYWADNVWKDIAGQADCLAYLPEVMIEHLHPHAQKAQMDATYDQAWPAGDHDQAFYGTWRNNRMAADVATVRALKEARRADV